MLSENYKQRLKTLAGILNEAKTHKNEYGALMLMIDFDGWKGITDKIDEDDLYTEKPGFGIEHDTHVTILFGFHKNADVDKMKEMIKNAAEEEIEITLTDITHFDNADKGYDVLKFDVKSPMLHKLNKIMTDNFDYTTDYPDYHPHVTIAYLVPGKIDKYTKKGEDIKVKCKRLCYSPPGDGKKVYFSI